MRTPKCSSSRQPTQNCHAIFHFSSGNFGLEGFKLYKIGSSRSKEASSYLPIYSCSFPELHSLEMLFKTILETLAKHCRSKAQLIRPATCSKAGFTQTSSAVRQFPPMEPSKILARPSIKTVWSLETCWGVSVSHLLIQPWICPTDACNGRVQWEMRICAKHGNLSLLVSLLSRKGTCDLRAAKALTTFLSRAVQCFNGLRYYGHVHITFVWTNFLGGNHLDEHPKGQ